MKSAMPAITESAFQRQVIQFAGLLGWTTYHTHDSRHSAAGFPDLVLVRERIVYIELKTERGRIRVEQYAWLERLKAAGAEAYIFRPSDWAEIERVLGVQS